MLRHRGWLQVLLVVGLGGCAHKDLNYEKIEPLEKNEEFEKMVKVKELAPVQTAAAASGPVAAPAPAAPTLPPPEIKTVPSKKKASEKPLAKAAASTRHEPFGVEDSEGFIGRRPVVDPFVIGEKVTLAVTYFNMAAGYMTLETRPFVEVNGKKSYHFYLTLKSSKVFNYFYSVDDWSETFVDYETLNPATLSINVKESKQLKEIRSFFDWKSLMGQYWETKVTADDGKKTKKKSWKILPFSQNVLSAAFYMRTFTYTPGKELAFRVADAGKNLVFTGKVLRKEKIKTEIGDLDTVVIQPRITIDGIFKQVGEIYIWLTDDDRKHIVRIESKIKIGTIIAKVKSIEYP